MTALTPGPWELDTGYIFSAEVPPRCVGSVAGWFVNPPTAEQLANGRAMASAHEALAVLKELAMSEHELLGAFQEATGIDASDLTRGPPESVRAFHHWVWLRNDVLRNKAAAALEKAGVR